MRRACLLLADGFEEIEAVILIDVLRRAEVQITTLSLQPGPVRGAHGITILPDAQLDAGDATAWDAVLLPGGMPGATNLRDHATVQSLLGKQSARGGITAAICA